MGSMHKLSTRLPVRGIRLSGIYCIRTLVLKDSSLLVCPFVMPLCLSPVISFLATAAGRSNAKSVFYVNLIVMFNNIKWETIGL